MVTDTARTRVRIINQHVRVLYDVKVRLNNTFGITRRRANVAGEKSKNAATYVYSYKKKTAINQPGAE